MIVTKFGGTSVQDAKTMEKSAAIVKKNKKTQIVVVSATAKTTNALLKVSLNHNSINLIEDIILRHEKIATDLDLSHKKWIQIKELFAELREYTKKHQTGYSAKERDYLLSFGERISSFLFTCAMKKLYSDKFKVTLFDIRKLLKTNNTFGDAIPLVDESKNSLESIKKHLYNRDEIIITQGFIGETLAGETTTIGRGGSDFSAALIAMIIKAKELHIWTDVSGVFTIDPKINPNASTVPFLSYYEAAELANLGAKILHPLTLTPCIEQNIPIYVGNTFNPHKGGTWIGEKEKKKEPQIKAISFRPKQTLVTFSKIKKLKNFGFLAEIFSILKENQMSIDHVTTSEISTSITLQEDDKLKDKNFLEKLNNLAPITIERNFGLVSLIGEKIIDFPHIQKKIFEVLDGHQVRSIFMGASQNNISFLVNKNEAVQILNGLHLEFFGN